MQYMENIIQRLEKYRCEYKITQEELAEKLGVDFTTVNRWLNFKVKPRKIQSYHIEKLLKKVLKVKNGEPRKVKSWVLNSAWGKIF